MDQAIAQVANYEPKPGQKNPKMNQYTADGVPDYMLATPNAQMPTAVETTYTATDGFSDSGVSHEGDVGGAG
jgi:hypothetical protein